LKIRITGLQEECDKFVEDLRIYYDLVNVSAFYPNTRKQKESKEGRVYIEARMAYMTTDGKCKSI
jgi:hypothetical protein